MKNPKSNTQVWYTCKNTKCRLQFIQSMAKEAVYGAYLCPICGSDKLTRNEVAKEEPTRKPAILRPEWHEAFS